MIDRRTEGDHVIRLSLLTEKLHEHCSPGSRVRQSFVNYSLTIRPDKETSCYRCIPVCPYRRAIVCC